MLLRYCFLLVILWVSFFPAVAAEMPFQNSYKESLVGYEISILRDEHRTINFTDIQHPETDKLFHPSPTKALSYNFTDAAIWVKINIQPQELANYSYMLKIGYALLDSISIYHQNQAGNWQVTQLGDMYPFSSRPVNHRHFLFPLPLEEKEPTTLYIRVRTGSAMVIPVDIQTTQELYEQDLKSEVYYGVFYGILLVMILFNLFIFLSLRDINYLFYPLSICGSLLYFFSLNGHMNQFLLGDYPYWSNKLVIVFMGLLATASALFAKNFLQIRQYSTKLNNLLNFVLISGLAIIASAFLISYSTAVRIAALLLIIDAFSLFATGLFSWYSGNKAARFFVIGWFVYLTGAVAIIFRNFGLLPHNFFTSQAVEIGSALEVIFLSLALSDQYRLLRQANEQAQSEALRIQQEANEQLERKVAERTNEINLQKEEIQSQRDSIEKQNRILELINFEIQKHSEKITSSIKYAKRIQEAILKHDHKISNLLPEHFILYKPRDIVSGDFYWLAEATVKHPVAEQLLTLPQAVQAQSTSRQPANSKIVLAAIDCTGHGVPGAFMSLIGDALLHQIVNEKKILEPGQILDHMHQAVRSTLNQNINDSRDGMDIALCVIDHESRTLEFAGAKNPLYLFRHQPEKPAELEIIQGDRFSIGGFYNEHQKPFTSHTIRIDSPTTFYIFTDGYQDQFGGSKNKKFMVSRFKNLLTEIHHLPMEEQKEILEETIAAWMQDNEQVDDILVIGVRI